MENRNAQSSLTLFPLRNTNLFHFQSTIVFQVGSLGQQNQALVKQKPLDSGKTGAKGVFLITCYSFCKMLTKSQFRVWQCQTGNPHPLTIHTPYQPEHQITGATAVRSSWIEVIGSPRSIAHVGLIAKGPVYPRRRSQDKLLVAFYKSQMIS